MTFADVVRNAKPFQKFNRPNHERFFYFDKQERLCQTYSYGFARVDAEDIAANDWQLEERQEHTPDERFLDTGIQRTITVAA